MWEKSNGNSSYRTIRDENSQISLFVGRSQNYKGDRYIKDYDENKNKLILEIFELEIYKSLSQGNKVTKGPKIAEKNYYYAFFIPGEGAINYVRFSD